MIPPFFSEVFNLVEANEAQNKIIGGDFNSILDTNLDKKVVIHIKTRKLEKY